MSELQLRIGRRTLLKLMGAAGASTIVGGQSGAPFGSGTVHAAGAAGRAGTGQASAGVTPFEIRVSDAELEDLGRRLQSPRWPPDSPGEPWSYGTDRAYLEELIAYWRDDYDWRAHETALNAFDHYTTTIDGQLVHFVHQRGRGQVPLALVMSHGWPGTILEMLPSLMTLADPVVHGGAAADAFDVVVPSIPGFGFSGELAARTDIVRTTKPWVALMDRLGYERSGAYGSDWGAGITRVLGASYPERLVGVHTPGAPPRVQREPETDEERDYLARANLWSVDETGYQSIQRTKPQTLAFGPADSPLGLAVWITEKLRSWSDCDVETRFSKDQILTLISSQRRRATGPVQVPQRFAEFVGIALRAQLLRRALSRSRLPSAMHWPERTERNIVLTIQSFLPDAPRAEVRARLEIDNARLRADYLQETRTLSGPQVRAASGLRPKNASEPASRWKREGRVFAIRHGGRDLYPAFQFRDGQPRPVIKRILREVPATASGWQIALWFASGNGWLDGAEPRDRLDAPDEVVEAARRLADRAEG